MSETKCTCGNSGCKVREARGLLPFCSDGLRGRPQSIGPVETQVVVGRPARWSKLFTG